MIVVCGDSFMAPDPIAPGRHFSELMGATSLAKPGCGNIDICFQIDEAIKRKAHYVIIGTTDPARTEIKLTDKKITPPLTLENFRNNDYISDTIPSLIGEEQHELWKKYNIPEYRRKSIKNYFVDVYDPVLKQMTDRWALEYWYKKLEENKINYILLPKSFCIYTYAMEKFEKTGTHESYTFHTDFATQELAANLLRQQ
jgi:hypothetical protein